MAYRAEYKEPVARDAFTIVKVVWRALEPVGNTNIEFLNTSDYPSRLLHKGNNVLHRVSEDGALEASENSGLLGASLSIAPNAETAEAMENGETELSGIVLANSISQGNAEGGVTLALRPRATNLSVGDTFLVDIVYSNPRRVDIDTVKLKIKFDPRVLQAVDYDEENWITRGTNIYDGEYHTDLPFDYHQKNTVYNGTGEIQCWMGFSSKVRVPSSGVIATIKFSAIAPSGSTEVAFDLAETEREQKTAISFLGFNLIGAPGKRSTALTNAMVRVN